MNAEGVRRLFQARGHGVWVPAFAGTTRSDLFGYPCSACNSFRIASPICVVETAVVPSDLMSAVRRPPASTAAIAEILAEGGTRTPDLGGNAGTKDLGAAVTPAIR